MKSLNLEGKRVTFIRPGYKTCNIFSIIQETYKFYITIWPLHPTREKESVASSRN